MGTLTVFIKFTTLLITLTAAKKIFKSLKIKAKLVGFIKVRSALRCVVAGQGNGARQGTTAVLPIRKSIRDVVFSVTQTFIRNLENSYLKETHKNESRKFRTLELADQPLIGARGGTQLSNSGLSGIRRVGSATSGFTQTSATQGSINNLQQATRVFGELRQAFQNAFLKRTNANTQAAVWRRKTAKQLLSGNASPFLALVGLTLASGPGIVTKQDELEFVCKEIQKSAKKTLSSLEEINEESVLKNLDNEKVGDAVNDDASSTSYSWSLNDFEFSSVIAKGCNAVVKAAKFKDSVLASFSGLAYSRSNDENEEVVPKETQKRKIETEESFVKPGKDIIASSYKLQETPSKK